MESESNLHNKNTEQLVNSMMSFLDEPNEYYKIEDFDESKNAICAGIKSIIGMFPAPPAPRPPLNTSFQSNREDRRTFSSNSRMKNINFEKACRHKDPYMQEVNRLMFCSTMGHPPNGSPEHFKAAESYALYGKEFLDFPTNVKFPKSMEISCFDGDVSKQLPSSFPKPNSYQGVGLQSGKYSNFGGNTNIPQLPSVMMNPANCLSYPFYQTPNLVQPLMYSNPFLMTQYLNMFVRETQINTSIVQQHQFLTGAGGIYERLVYAQMLQQQIQTNQTAQPCFAGNSFGAGVGKPKIKLQDLKKNETYDGNDLMKKNLNVNNLFANNLDLDD